MKINPSEDLRKAKVILMSEQLRTTPDKGDDLHHLEWFLKERCRFEMIVYLKGGFDDYRSRFPAAVTNIAVKDLNQYFLAHHNSLMGNNDLLVAHLKLLEEEFKIVEGCYKILDQLFKDGSYNGPEHNKAKFSDLLMTRCSKLKESVSFI